MTVFVEFLKIQPHSAEEILFPMNAMGIVAAITPGVFVLGRLPSCFNPV